MPAGSAYNTSFVTAVSVDDAVQAFVTGLSGGTYTVSMLGANNVLVTRRFRPMWSLIVGILFVFMLAGILVLIFVKASETLTIAMSPAPGGTRVTLSGFANSALSARLNSIIDALSASAPLAAAAPSLAQQGSTQASEASGWYVRRGSERFGPETFEGLIAWARSGKIVESDLVWGPGMPDWVHPAQVDGLGMGVRADAGA